MNRHPKKFSREPTRPTHNLANRQPKMQTQSKTKPQIAQDDDIISTTSNMILQFSEIQFLYLGLGFAGHSERKINRAKYSRNVAYFDVLHHDDVSDMHDLISHE